MKDLEQFLLDRAMEHDSPGLLFTVAAEYLISAKTIRPGVVVLAKMVASARASARALTWELVEHLLTGQVRGDLERLLRVDAGLGMTRLAWLTTPAVEATAAPPAHPDDHPPFTPDRGSRPVGLPGRRTPAQRHTAAAALLLARRASRGTAAGA